MAGIAEIDQGKWKENYINLLEKFEVALRINSRQIIIPSLMDDSAPDDVLSSISDSLLDSPPLLRFWLADHVSLGFWPRLICRVATDHQIGRVSVHLATMIGVICIGMHNLQLPSSLSS